jgi:predicted kinase
VRGVAAVSVVLMCGLPATGKTSTAMRLHAALGGVLVRSCDVYADLGIDLPAWVRRTRGFTRDRAAYEAVRDEAYREMARRLDAALAGAADVVFVDAVHGERVKRRAAHAVCAAHGRRPVLLWCRCDDAGEVTRRLAQRRGRERQPEHEASDASVVRHIRSLWEDPRADGVPLAIHDTLTGAFAAPPGPPFDALAAALASVEAAR